MRVNLIENKSIQNKKGTFRLIEIKNVYYL